MGKDDHQFEGQNYTVAATSHVQEGLTTGVVCTLIDFQPELLLEVFGYIHQQYSSIILVDCCICSSTECSKH
jgi:hypothetical protein